LQGATIADAGDVPILYGESQARFGQRVGQAMAQCCTAGTVPVVLGGDRSVTGAAVAGLRSDRPLTIVQISADPSAAAAEGAGQHLLGIDQVERVISLGAGDGAEGEAAARGATCSAAMLRDGRADEIVATWGHRLSIHLSIDLAVAAGSWTMLATNAPPPGPTMAELKAVIAAIGRAHDIVGIDLVGLDMQGRAPALAAVVACHLALAAMSAAHDRA
jgi:agmatinase